MSGFSIYIHVKWVFTVAMANRRDVFDSDDNKDNNGGNESLPHRKLASAKMEATGGEDNSPSGQVGGTGHRSEQSG